MREFHFKRQLTQASLNTIVSKYNFSDSTGIEKYIMDFEILFHLLKVLPDCAVKGGMAVPFHIDGNLSRLSEDIDIVTPNTREETESAIKILQKNLKSVVDIQPYLPKNPHRHLPLLTYDCLYKSSTDNSQIKLEIFYEDKDAIRTKMISSKFEIFGFKIDFPISVYDHAPLISDKLTTLAFNTIGIPESRRYDVPKHIYDIASLLKSFNGVLPIDEIIDVLRRVSETESQYSQNDWSFEDILKDLEKFSDSLVDRELKLNNLSQGHLGIFATTLLTSRYKHTSYLTDIFLIKLFVKLIQSVVNETQDQQTAGLIMNNVLTKLKDIPNQSFTRRWRRGVVAKYDDEEKTCTKILPDQQLYLYDCIWMMDHTGHLDNPQSTT